MATPKLTILLSGMIAGVPHQGGATWAVLQYLLGFRRLGHDVHLYEPVRSVLIEIASELAVPLRHHDPRIRYSGDFYGQTGKGQPLPGAISVDALIDILVALPSGATELACHPGLDDELQSTYRGERV